jgi:phage terminase large subunit-like protein
LVATTWSEGPGPANWTRRAQLARHLRLDLLQPLLNPLFQIGEMVAIVLHLLQTAGRVSRARHRLSNAVRAAPNQTL